VDKVEGAAVRVMARETLLPIKSTIAHQISAINEESAALEASMGSLQVMISEESRKLNEVRRVLFSTEEAAAAAGSAASTEAQAGAEVSPQRQQQLQQRLMVESLRQRSVQLKARRREVGERLVSERMVSDEQDAHRASVREQQSITSTVETLTVELRHLTRQVNHAHKMLEVQKASGTDETFAHTNEEMIARLTEACQREAHRSQLATHQLIKAEGTWDKWHGLLSVTMSHLQARSQHTEDERAGVVRSTVLSSTTAEPPHDDPLSAERHRGSPFQVPMVPMEPNATKVVDIVARSEAKAKALRERLTALDEAEAKALERLSKATERIRSHLNLIAHRSADQLVSLPPKAPQPSSRLRLLKMARRRLKKAEAAASHDGAESNHGMVSVSGDAEPPRPSHIATSRTRSLPKLVRNY